MMRALVARLRAAALPLFLSHVLTTALALSLAHALFQASPDAFAGGASPFDRRDFVALCRALRDLHGALLEMWPYVLLALCARAIVALLERAFWLAAMAGATPWTALRTAAQRQPQLWLVALLHMLAQAGWAALLWFAGRSLATVLQETAGVVMADFTRAGLLGAWALGAHLLATLRDSTHAALVCGRHRPRLREALSLAQNGLSRAALLNAACACVVVVTFVAGLVGSALAWPDRAPATLMAYQQACALAGACVQGLWVAYTVEAVARQVNATWR